MQCWYCNGEIGEEDNYCLDCGSAQYTVICKKCGQLRSYDDIFCICNKSLKKGCLECGGLSPLDAGICSHCGSSGLVSISKKTTRALSDIFVPEVVMEEEIFYVSGRVRSFASKFVPNVILLEIPEIDLRLEAFPKRVLPNKGVFEFKLALSEIGLYSIVIKSGIARQTFEVQCVEGLEEFNFGETERLCPECGVDVDPGDYFCPNPECNTAQELRFEFHNIHRTEFRWVSCLECGFPQTLDAFFSSHGDDYYFKTPMHEPNYPLVLEDLLARVNLYECPLCLRGGKRVKSWHLIPQSSVGENMVVKPVQRLIKSRKFQIFLEIVRWIRLEKILSRIPFGKIVEWAERDIYEIHKPRDRTDL